MKTGMLSRLKAWWRGPMRRVMDCGLQEIKIPTEMAYPPDPHRLLVKFYPWPNSYFLFVGRAVGKPGEVPGYRLHDPISKKDFVIPEELLNILFYRQ